MSVMEIDGLPAGSFDFVVCTLVLSELSDDEITFVLEQARRLLAPAGRLLIGDETTPSGLLRRTLFAILRFPLQLVTYLVTQAQSLPAGGWARTLLYFAMELPLMLLVFFFVPPTSRPLSDLEGRVRRAGFGATRVQDYLGGTLRLIRSGTG